jgi:hypothetical protein
VNGWRTMESAPRDGTRVLAFVMGYPAGRVCVAYFGPISGVWWADGASQDECAPTHWMPLPEVPR